MGPAAARRGGNDERMRLKSRCSSCSAGLILMS